jgi:hypothetical protein
MMAMTGNHRAMRTADTVFLKHLTSKKNVEVTIDDLDPITGLPGSQYLLTSDWMSLKDLKTAKNSLKKRIKQGLNWAEKVYWQSVIFTGGWSKTLGKSLPKDDSK